MDGFDPLGMHYLATPLPLTSNTHVTTDDYMDVLPTLGMQQQSNNYGTNCYPPNNQISNMPLSLPPDAEAAFTGGFDDFYPDTKNNPDPNPPMPEAESASIDRDNEVLTFHSPTYNFTLLDYSLRRTSLSISARLHGMFFLADPPATPSFSSQSSYPELTCYRRNLFQVTGSIRLPRNLRYILMDQRDRLPILGQELCISATESVEGHPVKLISVPWKTPVNNAPPVVPEDKTEKEPTSIPLDTMSNQDMDADFATFPIAWKRLQFRIATANNGRRRELQQHFVVRIKLVATLATGAKVPIAEAKSAAIIVRGRSPRNFQQRKELPVGGEKVNVKKSSQSPSAANQRLRADSSPKKSSLKRERSREIPFEPVDLDGTDAYIENASSNWPKRPQKTSSAPSLPTQTFTTPTVPSSKPRSSTSPQSAPQPLSLIDDPDYKPGSQRPPKLPRSSSTTKITRPHPYSRPSLPSLSSTKALLSAHSKVLKPEGLDPADLLYEYFPLGLDDWQPPVDAVYRPHVVHHIDISAGGASARPGIGVRNTRYFSDDTT